MTRRRNSPTNRPLGSGRPTKDREAIDSELRAARANRKADSQQKAALRRLEWDDEKPDTEEDDETGMFDEELTEETPQDAEDDENSKPGQP
jgi:hypothetical protein